MNFDFCAKLLKSAEDEPVEIPIEEEEQAYSSKGTSLTPQQMRTGKPGLFNKAIPWPTGGRIYDVGAGRKEMVETLREWFQTMNVTYLPYDKFHGLGSFNNETEAELKKEKADMVTSSNLLNVIPERKNRVAAVQRMWNGLKPGGSVYITVHRQSGKQPGQTGPDSWQNHAVPKHYLDEVQEVFPNAAVKDDMIVATK